MEKSNNFTMSWWQRAHSRRNRLWFTLRKELAISRSGYSEHTSIDEWNQLVAKFSRDAQAAAALAQISQRWPIAEWRSFLGTERLLRCLWTSWMLDEFALDFQNAHPRLFSPETIKGPWPSKIIDAGTQDFARGPAIREFAARYLSSETTRYALWLEGMELDAHPPLQGGYTRIDIGSWIAHHLPRTIYRAADFFAVDEEADVVTAFYPFVSPDPALAWGLPAEFGSAHAWVGALERTLWSGGLAFVLHQGEWEEACFDEARAESGLLELVARRRLECPFQPTPYPCLASLYRRK